MREFNFDNRRPVHCATCCAQSSQKEEKSMLYVYGALIGIFVLIVLVTLIGSVAQTPPRTKRALRQNITPAKKKKEPYEHLWGERPWNLPPDEDDI